MDLFAVWVLYRMAAEVAASRGELAAAGVPERATDIVVAMAWGIPAIVGLVILIESAKIARCHLRHRTAAA